MDENVLKLLLAILRSLMVAIPEFAAWLRKLIDGRTDPLSVRVADILPVESESRRVQRELEGES